VFRKEELTHACREEKSHLEELPHIRAKKVARGSYNAIMVTVTKKGRRRQ